MDTLKLIKKNQLSIVLIILREIELLINFIDFLLES
jgi:hypothetical protein